MTEPNFENDEVIIQTVSKAIGAEAQIYLGALEADPETAFDGQYYVRTSPEYGVYLYSNMMWNKQSTPNAGALSMAAFDIINAVNQGKGTFDDYLGTANNPATILALAIFAMNITVLEGGSLKGGSRYNDDGTVADESKDGWWFGAGSNAGAKMRGKILEFEFCDLSGNTVGKINADNILFDTEDYNTSLGYTCIPYSAEGEKNVALGYNCLTNLSTGGSNCAIGVGALYSCTSGSSNIAIGLESLYNLASGNHNIAIGTYALKNFDGSYSLAIGVGAAGSLIAGISNAVFGNDAAGLTTQLSHCVVLGDSAAKMSQTIQNSVIVGFRAAYDGTNADNSVIIGYCAAQETQAAYNVYIGYTAAQNNINGSNNVVIGSHALYDAECTTGSYITAIGAASLSKTSGEGNTALGYYAGHSNTIGAYNTFLGYNSGNASSEYSNITTLGANAQVTGNDQVQLGDSSTTVYAYGAVQDRSDRRDKADIQDTRLGLDFIMRLKPVDFRWDYREDYAPEETKDGSKKRNRFHHGFIAQDVKQIIDETGIDFGGYQDHSVNGGKDMLSLGYTEFIAPLVKAIQEQQMMIESLKKEIENIKKNNT